MVLLQFFSMLQGGLHKLSLIPFLFIVVEGLNKLNVEAKREGYIKCIKVTDIVPLSQLLFVDDIMLFCNGSIWELKKYTDVLGIYCSAKWR